MHDHILIVGVNAIACFDRLADLRERQRLYRFADFRRRQRLYRFADGHCGCRGHGSTGPYGLADTGTSAGLVGNSVS